MKHCFKLMILIAIVFLPLAAHSQSINYVINGRDVLSINVYDHPDLSIPKVQVSETGTITFPLLGEVQVKDLTATQVEGKLADLLSQKKIIVNPQINVFVEKYKLKRVVLIGEVNKPGQYDLAMDEPTFVADVISLGVGLNRDAGETLIILRKTKGVQEKIVVDLTKLLKHSDMSQNVEVMDGDLLYVQRAGYYYIYGEVNHPGHYKIEEDMSVIKAISMAGGPTELASTLGIRVIRKVDDRESTIRVKLNSPQQANDDFFENSDMTQDIKVVDGDIIYMPRSEYFYVYGQVNRPGHYKVEPDLTVIKAITIAGGINNKASTDRIKITRKIDKKEISLDVKLDAPVQGEDVIIIPESYF